MTVCLPLYSARYSIHGGLIIAALKPARGKQTRNDLVGKELDFPCREYVNESARLLHRAQVAHANEKLERLNTLIAFLAANIQNTLTAESNQIERLPEKSLALAEIIALEAIDDSILTERQCADILRISQPAYRKNWATRKMRFKKCLYTA